MAVFRVEKNKNFTIMANYHLQDKSLSLKAKGLLSIMLSLPEDWDYMTKGLVSITKESESAITTTLKELEAKGYLCRQRVRNEQGRLGETEYTIQEKSIHAEKESTGERSDFHEKKKKPKRNNPSNEGNHKGKIACGESGVEREKQPSPDLEFRVLVNEATGEECPDLVGSDDDLADSPHLDLPDLDFPVLDNPVLGKPHLENPKQYNTKESNTKLSSTNPINHSIYQIPMMDRDWMDALRKEIKKNIEFDILFDQYGERLDDIVEIIFETMCTQQSEIAFSDSRYRILLVRDRLMSLTSSHIQYIFDCLDSNGSEIRNIKKYLLKTLIDAPATMDSYYTAKVKSCC